ncbi:MAG: tetratricopeptide repeat protein, partial [Methylomonas sp.]
MTDNSLEPALSEAITLHQSGQLSNALAWYLSILQIDPNHADVHHNLGILARQIGRPDAARHHFSRALNSRPRQAKFWCSYIQFLLETQAFSEALQILNKAETTPGILGADLAELKQTLMQTCDRVLHEFLDGSEPAYYPQAENLAYQIVNYFPDQNFAWKMLGKALEKSGRHAEALHIVQTALSRWPADAEGCCHAAGLLNQIGRATEAIANYQRALELQPDFVLALSHLGVLLHNLGRYREAEQSLYRAAALKPLGIEELTNLAVNLQTQGRAGEAEAYFRRAIAIDPSLARLHFSLSVALKMQGRLGEAEASCTQALLLAPANPQAHSHLGAIRFDQGLFSEAEACYARAVLIEPNDAEAYNNLGSVLQFQREYGKAETNYRQAIKIKPFFPQAHANLGINLQSQGRVAEAEACWRISLSQDPEQLATQSGLTFHLSYTAGLAGCNYVEEARKYGRLAAKRAQPYRVWRCGEPATRLRVGLVSGDFRNHPVGHFLHGLLKRINPEKIELIAYANQPGADSFTARLQPYFSGWKNISGLDDAAAAQLIHADGVHILIDLSGHSSYHRLSMFAWKPAPVQVSWLGFLGTTGVAAMDYVLSDACSLRAADEKNFTEKIWRLPASSICFTPATPLIEVNPLPALTRRRITFASFNNLAKMGDQVVELWARVLHGVPGSRLLLKAGQLNDAALQTETLARFAARQIASERIMLFGTLPDPAAHLAVYHQVDIALDTFPYPGVTTSIEALWMGVPVLTLQGPGVLARAGECVNINAGLSDWIATDEENFVERDVGFAKDLNKLAL